MRAILFALCVVSVPAFAAEVPPAVIKAVSAAGAIPGSQVEAIRFIGPRGCVVETADLDQLIVSSGTVPVRIEGSGIGGARCEGMSLAEVRVTAPVWVAQRPIATGERLEGSVIRAQHEIRSGRAPIADIPFGAVATRPMQPGAIVEQGAVQDPAWMPGAPVHVVLRSGTLSLVQLARVVPCPPGRACAQLPSGRRVEGRRAGNELILEVP
ncbi:MAG: hypothetical protein JST92_08425 [Deltaproteobacteria bacterium]|nr:hypothetical protein [Deltaproteobacteria bacterium]